MIIIIRKSFDVSYHSLVLILNLFKYINLTIYIVYDLLTYIKHKTKWISNWNFEFKIICISSTLSNFSITKKLQKIAKSTEPNFDKLYKIFYNK